jgi:hypothetical protein
MTFFDRSYEEIVAKSIERLSANTNITQLAPGGKTRFLLETIAEEQSNQHQIFDSNLMQVFIRYADDKFLGYLGDMLNLPQREASHAESDDSTFMFYVASGTFGDINGGLDFSIPAGTVVSTVPLESTVITPGIESQPVIEYTTLNNVTCLAGQSFAYVPIRAVVEGSSSVVPKNVLKQHDFSSYALASRSLLKCTNQYSIANGEDRESPASYRYRLANVFKARELAVPASIRLAALSVPGVADIKEVLCEQGTGSYSVYVKSTTPTTSNRLINEVMGVCYSVTAYGIRPYILAPEPIGLEFVCAVNWKTSATTEQIANDYKSMRNALEERLNTTEIGEEIILKDLVDLLLSSARYAVSIGAEKANHFEEVYAYRTDPASDGTTRTLVYGDKVTPLYNERVILETSGRHRGIQFLTRQV